jgi:hypothetical protein
LRTSTSPAELPFATLVIAFITIRTEHSGKAGRTRLQHKLRLSWRLYLHLAFQIIGLKSLDYGSLPVRVELRVERVAGAP